MHFIFNVLWYLSSKINIVVNHCWNCNIAVTSCLIGNEETSLLVLSSTELVVRFRAFSRLRPLEIF